MIRLFGRSAGSSAAAGFVKRILPENGGEERKADVACGITEYEEAKRAAADKLDSLFEKAFMEAGVNAARIFEARKMLLEDKGLDQSIRDLVLLQHFSVHDAICKVCDGEAEKLENSGSELIAARAEDIREIRDLLTGAQTPELNGFQDDTVLCADMLTAAEILELDPKKVKGIVCAKGSELSHAAILAADLGIASVWGCGDELMECAEDGMRIALDTVSGEVFVGLDEESAAGFIRSRNRKELPNKYKKAGVKLFANIDKASDVIRLMGTEAAGIGLFRSEYLYMGRNDAPNEEEQFLEYKKAVQMMKPLPVTVRTADLGGDKLPGYMEDKGKRGLALSLAEPELFKAQLRAVYRAAQYGNIKLMFPLVRNAEEFEKALEICKEVRGELMSRAAVPIGVMIETKAAVEDSLELSKKADFISIGTNDLYAEVLGMDKRDESIADETKAREEVMKLTEKSINNGHEGGAYVVICGRLAEDAAFADKCIAMGADGVSLPAALLG